MSIIDDKEITIGIVLPALHESCQSMIWPGITDHAKDLGINLITFVATSQDQISSLDLHYDVIKDFVKNGPLDGVIVFSGAMGEHKEHDEVVKFCHEVKGIPTVSIALEIPEVPSVLVENTSGILELIDHLVQVHNYNRIVFIKGPEGHDEAEERFTAYLNGLKNNNIPEDGSLIFPGEFSDTSGEEAVQKLLEDKIKFDAILCVDDETAMGAMAELKKHNYNIPGDIAIAGFDDVTEASLVLPSLTTVRQPLYKQGKTAILTLLDIINQKEAPKRILLPTESVYRRSCGCFPESVNEIGSNREKHDTLSEKEAASYIYKSVTEYYDIPATSINKRGDTTLKELTENFFEKFIDDIREPSNKNLFLNTVDKLLYELKDHQKNSAIVLYMLSSLSSILTSIIQDSEILLEANHLIQKSRALVNEHVLRQTQSDNMNSAQQQLRIREASQRLITTFEMNRLLHVIAEEFPKLDIESFYLALYPEAALPIKISDWEYPEHSVLLMGYHGERIAMSSEVDHIFFKSANLFPRDLFPNQKHSNLIFMPLFFKDEHFGFIVFEHDKRALYFMYEELRLHLSSAMKSSFMLRELRTQSIRDELTGLYNRRGFIELGKNLVKSGNISEVNLWMFYIDLDGLKMINDTYGHDEGDIAIKATANILKQTFRKQDILGRMGGDEFTVIIASEKDIDPESVLYERLEDNIAEYNKLVEKPYKLSMCIGASRFNGRGEEAFERVMKEADDILMAKKKRKKEARRGKAQ